MVTTTPAPAFDTATTAPYSTVSTSELRAGDVVTTCGLRVLLHGEPRVYSTEEWAGSARGPVYVWPGLVLNEEEAVNEYRVPREWLHYDGSGQRHDEARWTIQGNDLATWQVQRAA